MPKRTEENKAPYLVEVKAHSGDVAVLTEYLISMAGFGWKLVTIVHDSTFIFEAVQ